MRPRNLAITGGAFAASIAVDAAWGSSTFPGYGATIGLFGCVAIIVISKWLGSHLLSRPESWLGEDAPKDTHPDLHQADATEPRVTPVDEPRGGGHD